jgi:hypothetical protein
MKVRHDWVFGCLLIIPILFCCIGLRGQCSGGTSAGALLPAPAVAWQTIGITTGNYYTFTVPGSTGCAFPTYYFSFCSSDGGNAGFDTQITILNNAGTFAGGYSDDFCGLQSYVQWVPTAAGTYRVLLNTYFCGAGSGATMAYRMVPAPAPNASFSFVNNATAGTAGCATLTTATNGQGGCAWDIDNTLNMLAPFTYDFTIFLGNNDAGADGMAFVVQNSPLGRCACGSLGGALGAAGIPNSLIFEIDTYINAEDRDDGMAGVLCTGGPEPDHLDVWLNGNINPPGGGCPTPPGPRIIPAAIKLMNGAADYNIENGLNHRCRISWVPGAPGTLTMRIYDNAGITLYGTVSYTFTPMAIFGTNTPFFGFTASTGGLNNLQTFCEPPSVVLATEDIQLSAAKDAEMVRLTWQAPDAFVISHVERSSDGNLWQQLFTSPRPSTASTQEGLDRAPMIGTNYYRVTMKDANGEAKISNVVEVVMAASDEMVVYPNPSEGRFTIELPNAIGKSSIQMTDIHGRIVFEGPCESASTTISTTHLAAGVYQLSVKTPAKTLHRRVVIRN